MLFLTVWCSFIIGLTRVNFGSSQSAETESLLVDHDQPVFASCYSTGSSNIIDIYWTTPDGQRVNNDQESGVFSSQRNGLLLLTMVEADKADEGVYTCQELSAGGVVTVIKRFTVRIMGSSGPPSFEVPYEVIEAIEGRNITLRCEARGDLPMLYTWYDPHGSIITGSSPDAVIVRSGNASMLYLKEVSNRTSGVYTCAASNNLGTNSRLIEVVIIADTDFFRPFFNQSREVVYGEEFQDLTLICDAESNPHASYKWFNEYGEELGTNHTRLNSSDPSDRLNSSVIIEVRGTYGLLTFVRLMKSDRGSYTCTAENRLGLASKYFQVYVNATTDERRPVFKEIKVSINAFEDEPLTLNCQAEGNPRPTYVWYNKYGEKLDRFHQRVVDLDLWNHSIEIPQKRPSTILVSPSNGTLVFVQLKSNDDGSYTCNAINSAGQAGKIYTIHINATEVDKDNLTVSIQNVTHDSVTFELITRGSYIAKGFEARYRLTDWNDFSTIRWSVEQEYKVTGLLSGAEYYFQFRIWSSDIWTDLMPVVLPPGKPEIIVKRAASNTISMEFFRPVYLFFYKTLDRYVIKYRVVTQRGGNAWDYSDCEVTIDLPSCRGSSYEISNLGSSTYYSITVTAIGRGGHSEPSEIKIYVP